MFDYLILGLGITGLACLRYLKQQNPATKILVADNRIIPSALKEVRQNFPEVECRVNVQFTPDLLKEAKQVVVSPGINLQKEPLASFRKYANLWGEMEIFKDAAQHPMIGITGSNGKSTVTTMIAQVLQAAEINAAAGGNLGPAALDLLAIPADYYVLELSSFQLETVTDLPLKIALFLNLSADHQDRYPNMNQYLQAKRRIFQKTEFAVVCADQPETYPLSPYHPKFITFGLSPLADFRVEDNAIWHQQQLLLEGVNLKIKGQHNLLNTAAVLAVSYILELPWQTTLNAVQNFPGLPHRCQWIRKKNGVTWYNDSKGTNLGATIAALKGLSDAKNTILILGGLGKNADFSLLNPYLIKQVKTLILFGQDADLIRKQINFDGKILNASSLKELVNLADLNSRPGDQVLFSPACASMDMFKNFEERGNQFMEQVLAL